jgi:hypothetical protein
MAFKIRRGTDAERLTITPADGELIYTTDTKHLYVGDGITIGGNIVSNDLPISQVDDNIEITPIGGVIVGDETNNGFIRIIQNNYINTSTNGPIQIHQHHNTNDSNNFSFYRSKGSSTSQTAVNTSTKLSDITWHGHDGTSQSIGAALSIIVQDTISTGIIPTGFVFYTHDAVNSGTLGLKAVLQLTHDNYLLTNKIKNIDTDGNLTLETNGTGRIIIDNLTWPSGDGNVGDLLSTDGNGELSWVSSTVTGYATETYVDNAISNLVNGADGALDTLKELGDELTNNASAVSALTTAISNKITNADTGTLTPGDMFFTQTGDTVSMGALDAQNITAGPSGIQIAGTGGITIMGVATAGVTLGGGTSGAIDFASGTTGIDYNDLDNKPSIPDLGNVAQDILPTEDVTYDLGSPGKRFRDLYLSGSTIDLGGKTLSITGNTLSIGGNKFGESGNVVGVAITQLYNNTVYIRLDVGSAAETIANNIIAGDILKLDPAVGLITQLTVVSNDGGIVDTNNTAFKDYELTVAETGPSNAVNIFFDLVKPIATDVKQLKDSTGLLNRTSISSGPTAPGSAAVANANDVSINFSDAVGTKFKFNRDGKIDFPATQYGSSVSTMFAEYGFRFRPTWNGTGTGPELAISWNDGIELTPITNDHFTIGNKATPFFIQGTPTDQAGKLPGDVWVDGGFNGPANTKGIVNIGRGRTSAVNIGQSGTATTITFNDGSSITSANGLGGDILGDQNVDGGGGAVDVWSSPVNTAGMTAKVVVSGKDLATGETQSCEVLLAKKMGSQLVNVTVYAIVHTSASPLFTVSATVETDGQIRVNATVPGSIATVNVKSVGRVTVF